jgi:hypothetical protein
MDKSGSEEMKLADLGHVERLSSASAVWAAGERFFSGTFIGALDKAKAFCHRDDSMI